MSAEGRVPSPTTYIVHVDRVQHGLVRMSKAAAHREAARVLPPGTLYVITTGKHAVVDVRRTPSVTAPAST